MTKQTHGIVAPAQTLVEKMKVTVIMTMNVWATSNVEIKLNLMTIVIALSLQELIVVSILTR